MGLLAGIARRIRALTSAGPRAIVVSAALANTNPHPIPFAVTQWDLGDIDDAIASADTGNLRRASQLCGAIRRDGVASGVLSTRTEGLVHLPLRYEGGDERAIALLQGDLQYLAPSAELALLAGDGILLGLGLGELVQYPGFDLPTLRRLDPEFLQYRWSDDTWWYQSIVGLQKVTPGDGRWVLHLPGGAVAPWRHGLWTSLARAYIAKDHAFFLRENYSGKLANPARVAYSPSAATDQLRIDFFNKLAQWGPNTTIELPPGWDAKLLESNGVGFQVYENTIKSSNEEITINIAGQVVTTSGGAGFSNSAIHATIRSDLIQSTANALARTINEQIIPVWGFERFGAAGVVLAPRVFWDVTPPKDQAAEAGAIKSLAEAIKVGNEALEPYRKRVDAVELASRYGVPIDDLEAAQPVVTADDGSEDVDLSELDENSLAASLLELTPSDQASITTVEEGRASSGFGPLLLPDGSRDPDNDLTIAEFTAKRQAAAEVIGDAEGQDGAVDIDPLRFAA